MLVSNGAVRPFSCCPLEETEYHSVFFGNMSPPVAHSSLDHKFIKVCKLTTTWIHASCFHWLLTLSAYSTPRQQPSDPSHYPVPWDWVSIHIHCYSLYVGLFFICQWSPPNLVVRKFFSQLTTHQYKVGGNWTHITWDNLLSDPNHSARGVHVSFLFLTVCIVSMSSAKEKPLNLILILVIGVEKNLPTFASLSILTTGVDTPIHIAGPDPFPW